jgi:hypothetical protein
MYCFDLKTYCLDYKSVKIDTRILFLAGRLPEIRMTTYRSISRSRDLDVKGHAWMPRICLLCKWLFMPRKLRNMKKFERSSMHTSVVLTKVDKNIDVMTSYVNVMTSCHDIYKASRVGRTALGMFSLHSLTWKTLKTTPKSLFYHKYFPRCHWRQAWRHSVTSKRHELVEQLWECFHCIPWLEKP